jgi:hypothetical protein
MTMSATGVADPAESSSPHARIVGRDDTDDDDMIIDGNYW